MVNELDIKKEEDIESFINWLHYFFRASSKRKSKLIKKIEYENVDFARWLFSIRDFDIDMQYQLYSELRNANW